ncbi:glycosyltransferase family 2 protein [Empedobacter falsenii]
MKISIIIPVYNAEKVIIKCISSILNQSYQNFELILIDDGSKDNSLKVCEEFCKNDERIILKAQKNSGPSKARNFGIDLANGDFICFIDADDWIEEDYLKTFVDNYVNTKTLLIQDICKDRVNLTGDILDSKINCGYKQKIINRKDLEVLLIDYKLFRYGYPFGKFYNLSIIKTNNIRFDDKIHFSEDLLFFLEYLLYQDSIYFLKDAKYHYIVTGDSLSNKYHTFSSEILCYNRMKYLVNLLYLNTDFSFMLIELNKSIGHFLTRSLESMYRPSTKLRTRERLRILKEYNTKENIIYFSAFNEKNIKKINAYLFKYKLLFMFDLFLSFQFYIRYQFNNTWVKYRKYILNN